MQFLCIWFCVCDLMYAFIWFQSFFMSLDCVCLRDRLSSRFAKYKRSLQLASCLVTRSVWHWKIIVVFAAYLHLPHAGLVFIRPYPFLDCFDEVASIFFGFSVVWTKCWSGVFSFCCRFVVLVFVVFVFLKTFSLGFIWCARSFTLRSFMRRPVSGC